MTAKPNIHQRLHAAMQRVEYIQRERKKGMQYSIVSHDAVTAKVRPVLVDNGVIYYPVALEHRQDGNRTEVALTVRFANIDDPSDFIDVPSLGYGVDPSDKGPGKAVSYAVKYALLKALGMESGDDPDTEPNSVHVPDQGRAGDHSRPVQPVNGAGQGAAAGAASDDEGRTKALKYVATIRKEAQACESVKAIDDLWERELKRIKALYDKHQDLHSGLLRDFNRERARFEPLGAG